ncbi:MAG TPA: VIT1/CCC1 transporter family protein [Candidatus Bathyarchaeia archaeon]
MDIDEGRRKKLLIEQQNELDSHHIYGRLSRLTDYEANRGILAQISEDELRHYIFLRDLTGEELEPNKVKVTWHTFIARVLGLTFAVKLMERGEEEAQESYGSLAESLPGVKGLIEEEETHERNLIDMIDEERLEYVGSIVLGLNDALVELTGTLAGLSFAFQNNRLIALSGLITGIAASMSMGASEYLSIRADEGKNALRASLYTGTAYVLTVALLVAPFFVFDSYVMSLPVTLLFGVLIILAFNYYVSVAKGLCFKKQFSEMAGISLGVSALSFIVGVLVKTYLGVDV